MSRLGGACLAGLVAACARIEAPPGGPPDTMAPVLAGVSPDSLGSYPGFDRDVEFRFNEVVSEGGQPNFGLGSGDLEKLVVLSPTTEVPVVRWRRDRITARPREGWRPNTVYRVELLAGVRDLRNNSMRSSAVVTFTTGTDLPTDTLVGRVVDWTTSRPARGALVEAILQPDSLVYRTVADSTGRFAFGPLPAGEYLVFGALDQNRNGRRDPRENFDSLRVAAGRDSVGELWAFRRDSTGPRIQTASRTDSLSATLSFTGHLDPYQRVTPDSVRVRLLPDSTDVPVELLLPQVALDSILKARADSANAADTTRRAAPDSVPARPAAPPPDTGRRIPGVPRQVVGARPPERDTTDTGPLTTRPPLFDRLTLRVGTPWTPGGRYVIEVFGLRNAGGVAGDARTVLVIPPAPPRPPAPDSARGRPDTAAARADTTRADTLRLSAPPPLRP